MKKTIGSNNQIVNNTIYHSPVNFFIYEEDVYYNQEYAISGSFQNNLGSIPQGFTKIGRLNTDSPDNAYPFVIKDTDRQAFRSTTKLDYRATADGANITGSYPLSASISVYNYGASLGAAERKYLNPLRNVMTNYMTFSNHFQYSSSLHGRDLDSTDTTLIDIPSVFYGSSMKKGSVSLKFYVTGSLIGELVDSKRNGELIQRSGSVSANDGKVAGVVLYNHGVVLLTGSWNIDTTHSEDYLGTSQNPKWKHFGTSLISSSIGFSSFSLDFESSVQKSTMMMFLNASKGAFNFSHNNTFIEGNEFNKLWTSGSYKSKEPVKNAANVVSGSYNYDSATYEPTTYISEVFVYDDEGDVIMKGKLGKPLRKRLKDDLTIKLRYDL
jgi:hypothetical protein